MPVSQASEVLKVAKIKCGSGLVGSPHRREGVGPATIDVD